VLEREVDDELAFHLQMRAEKLRRSGLAADAAHREALARFGDAGSVRNECLTIDTQYAREMQFMDWLESIIADLRYAARTLRRAPLFTAVAVVTIALGIGATSAVFSLVDGILLRPLPYPQPDRLVQFMQSYPEKGLATWTLSEANATIYAERARSFSHFAAYTPRLKTIGGAERPEQVQATMATSAFFDVMGVAPMLGRTFRLQEFVPKQSNAAILSYGFWQSHFAGDPRVLGKTLLIEGNPTPIVGVMPPRFAFGALGTKLWMPLGLDRNAKWGWNLFGVARLAPGVTVAQATRETTAIIWAMGREDPNLVSRSDPPPPGAGLKTLVTPLRDAIVGDSARNLLVLQSAVVLILLIAVANVATLLLARGATRTRELALRSALGASRTRVARQLLTESIVLSLAGAVLGVGLAAAALRALPHLPIAFLPRADEVRLDTPVLFFTLGVAVVAGLLFGVIPAWHGRRYGLATDLTSGQRGSSHRSTRRVNGALVAAQIALSLVLLIGAGLALKSMRRLLTLDFGFQPEGVTAILVPLPSQRYGGPHDGQRITQFSNDVIARVRALPGVRNAAASWGTPFNGNGSDGYRIEGHESAAGGGDEPQTGTTGVSPGYFATLGIPLLRGRDFDATDRDSSLQVAIVDETLAKRFWPAGNAIGHRILMTGSTTWLTIVGVVGAIRDNNPADPPMPHTYFPYSQAPGRFVNLTVRTSGDSRMIIPSVLRTVASLEPGVPLDKVRSLDDLIRSTLSDRRLMETLLGAFAVLALTLATVGIYGVMSLFVTNRQREFGIRLAVGAEPASLVRLVLRQGFVLAASGVLLGILGALIATRSMRVLLYDVSPTDPLVFTALPLALLFVAMASCWLPARRATRSDPLDALRAD
jgi:predicted permease